MKKLKPKFLALIFLLTATVFSCREDENPAPVEVAILAFSETIAENPTVGTSLGSLSATTNRGTLVYSLTNQNPAGALTVDSLTGELSVANANLFDFEANPELTATGIASVEGVSQSAAITIILTDVKEGNTVGGVTVTAEDFSVTIDENPEAKQSLGTLKATTTEGTLSYALASQTPEGALSIDAGSGELTVANAAEFDYEVNKTITAQAVATTGAVSDTAIVTVTLKDVDEAITAEAFSATIDEEPNANQVLGTLKASASMGTLTYAIVAGQADSAFAVNATSGELSVANRKAFDYETSPTVKATYEVSNGTDTVQNTITITLNDITEVVTGTIPFVTTWTVTSGDQSITIPTDDATQFSYDYSVDWGDGSTSENQTGDVTHIYDNVGTYAVKITGKFPAIRFKDYSKIAESRNKIMTIEQWGDIAWESFFSAFHGCKNLTYNATDAPDLSNVTRLREMFAGAQSFNGGIGNWDVSNVQDMQGMFQEAYSFNQPLNDWDVSNVVYTMNMFNKAYAFNQPLNNWDVSSVTSMNGLFHEAKSFNRPLNDWDVSNVGDFRSMFLRATAFSQDLNGWDLSSATHLAYMFQNATNFNGNVIDWDVSGVTDFTGMFSYCSFNRDISGWDVSSNATELRAMFSYNRVFNQDISDWDVSNVEEFYQMFSNAEAFNQNLGKWAIRAWERTDPFYEAGVPNMREMFDWSGMSPANYGATLKGWADQSDTPTGIRLGADEMKYCGVGQTARNLLINNKSWVFENDTSCD